MAFVDEIEIACIVMAAGAAKRFGGGKLLQVLDGKALIERALDAVPQELFSRVCVVAGDANILALARQRSFRPVLNDRPDDGASRTVRLGLKEAGDCGAALFMAADQPFLRRETVARLVGAYQGEPDRIAALSHGGVRGNPCIFPARFFPELLSLEGDRGGSTVIRLHPDSLLLVEAEAIELADVDTREELDTLKR